MTRGKPNKVTEESRRPLWVPAEPEREIIREPIREPISEPDKVPVRVPVRR